MNLKKLAIGKPMTYRPAGIDEVQFLDLKYDLLKMVENDELAEDSPSALQFLGMLWLEVELNRLGRKPRTLEEKRWYAEYELMLAKKFPLVRDTRKLNITDPNITLHVDMQDRLKRLLVALAFNNLSDASLAKINEMYAYDKKDEA